MPRSLRIEYPGACYHVMCRGDRREPIFLSDADRELFVATLGQVCEKTGWRVHAYVLMPNHYHLLLETPEPNLVAGMRWFQGTYTTRFNRRNRMTGHLFQGRYKALLVDGTSEGYLRTVSTYVHLNPVRARLVKTGEIVAYPWSSVRYYVGKKSRPEWMSVDRVMGELGLGDSAAGRRRYREYLEGRASAELESESSEAYAAIRRGWCLGDDAFCRKVLSRLEGYAGSKSHSGGAVRAHGEAEAIRIAKAELKRLKISLDTARDLSWRDPRKRRIAQLIRSQTVMSNAWVGEYLGGGHESTVSRAVHEQE